MTTKKITEYYGLTEVPGYTFCGYSAGLKSKGKPDLALIYSEQPANAAAVFTRNEVKAEPVKISRKNIRCGEVQLVVINSKNANACTGKQGEESVHREIAAGQAEFGVKPEHVFVMSTGVIGRRFPIEQVEEAITGSKEKMGNSGEHSNNLANAILTTDTRVKGDNVTFEIDGKIVHMAGVSKGSGMIHPNMGTMLGFILCDIAIDSVLLNKALEEVAERTFNMITVDGDTSTNDSVLVMCNGKAGNKKITKKDKDYHSFVDHLEVLCQSLSRQIVADGEGISKMIEYRVNGLKEEKHARKIVKTLSTSLLVKTAFFGKDPNWGRLLAAAGRAGIAFQADAVDLYFGQNQEYQLLQEGQPVDVDLDELKAYMDNETLVVTMDFDEGDKNAVGWGTDLSYEYVRINAEYTT